MTRSRAFAYSLILCSSLSLNCLTVQQTWAADSSAATSPPAATESSGSAATTPAATPAATTPPAAASSATAGTPPAGTTPSASSTPAGTPTPAGAAVSSTLAATAPGPLQADRNKVRNWILAAQKRGVGISGYQRAFDDMENAVRAGEPEANVKTKLYSMLRAINDQYHASAKIQRNQLEIDRKAAFRTGGLEPKKIMYVGPEKKWQGKQVDDGVISEIAEQAYKKELYRLTEEQRRWYPDDVESMQRLSPRDVDSVGGRLNAAQQLQLQREEVFQRHINKHRGQTGQPRLHNPSMLDLTRNSNSSAYYQKSKLRREQQQWAQNSLNERYNKQTWINYPHNEGDY